MDFETLLSNRDIVQNSEERFRAISRIWKIQTNCLIKFQICASPIEDWTKLRFEIELNALKMLVLQPLGWQLEWIPRTF